MVLEKANHIPIYSDVVISNHSKYDIPNHNTVVIVTCKNHVIIDVFPRLLIILGLSSIPTIKSRKLIHM